FSSLSARSAQLSALVCCSGCSTASCATSNAIGRSSKPKHPNCSRARMRCARASAGSEKKSQLLETTLEHMDQGIMVVDANRIVALCNRRAIEIMELPEELMASHPRFDEVLAYQAREQEYGTDETLKEIVRRAGALDQPRVRERRRPNARMIEFHNVPLPGGGAVRTFTDITARKAAEEQIAAARQQAE